MFDFFGKAIYRSCKSHWGEGVWYKQAYAEFEDLPVLGEKETRMLFFRPSDSVSPFPEGSNNWKAVRIRDYSDLYLEHLEGHVDRFTAISVYTRKTGDRLPVSVKDLGASPTTVLLDLARLVRGRRQRITLIIAGVAEAEAQSIEQRIKAGWDCLEKDNKELLAQVHICCCPYYLTDSQFETISLPREVSESWECIEDSQMNDVSVVDDSTKQVEPMLVCAPEKGSDSHSMYTMAAHRTEMRSMAPYHLPLSTLGEKTSAYLQSVTSSPPAIKQFRHRQVMALLDPEFQLFIPCKPTERPCHFLDPYASGSGDAHAPDGNETGPGIQNKRAGMITDGTAIREARVM